MLGQELGIEQFKAASDQMAKKMNKRDFAGIARTGEHAFAKKSGPKLDAI